MSARNIGSLHPKFAHLVVPVGRPVLFSLRSADVLHSFFIPAMRFKRYAYPDSTNRFVLTFPHDGPDARRVRPVVRMGPRGDAVRSDRSADRAIPRVARPAPDGGAGMTAAGTTDIAAPPEPRVGGWIRPRIVD